MMQRSIGGGGYGLVMTSGGSLGISSLAPEDADIPEDGSTFHACGDAMTPVMITAATDTISPMQIRCGRSPHKGSDDRRRRGLPISAGYRDQEIDGMLA